MGKQAFEVLSIFDPLLFLVDDEIKAFQDDQRYDLTGQARQAARTKSTGLYIVHEHVVKEDTVEIITNVFHHCWTRTDIGAVDPSFPEESWRIMRADEVAGWVLFDNWKDNNQPYEVSNNYNPANTLVDANNTGRSTQRGTTLLTQDQPFLSNVGMRNPLNMFFLPPKSVFQVTFQLMPQLTTAQGAVPNQLVIGNPGENGQGIDGAGACVTGIRLPMSKYEKLKKLRLAGLI